MLHQTAEFSGLCTLVLCRKNVFSFTFFRKGGVVTAVRKIELTRIFDVLNVTRRMLGHILQTAV